MPIIEMPPLPLPANNGSTSSPSQLPPGQIEGGSPLSVDDSGQWSEYFDGEDSDGNKVNAIEEVSRQDMRGHILDQF